MASAHAITMLRQAVAWYADRVYGRIEGPGCVPFYCDPQRVGAFAVDPRALARGAPEAVFGLFAALTMYQSRRDVDIMAKQREMSRAHVALMTKPRLLARAILAHPCAHLVDATRFGLGCDVYRRDDGRYACATRPRTPCHVKTTSAAIARMAPLGKLPTSAWLQLREAGGNFEALRASICAAAAAPARRAQLLVAEIAKIFHVGEKLA